MEVNDEASLLFDDATADIATGDLDSAIPKLKKCVELEARNAEYWHALGLALFKNGNAKEGIGAALMATTINPNDLLTWTALSQMYVSQGNIPDAEAAKANARILSMGGKL